MKRGGCTGGAFGKPMSAGAQVPVERMLHVFAGEPRLGSFADAAASLHAEVDQLDLLRGGVDNDMSSLPAQQAVLAAVRAGTYAVVWIGTPCSSFSLWWLDASMRQLRSRERPGGVLGLPARERAYLRKHNALVDFSAELAMAAFMAGATFVIENPPDRGAPLSPLFRWTARQHAPLWLMPCMRQLATATKPVWLTFPQCAMGGDFQKWTVLMAAGPRAEQLQALGRLTCTHEKHKRVAQGRDSNGESNAAASGAYPLGMAAFVMYALVRPELRSPPGAHANSDGPGMGTTRAGVPPPSDVAPFVGAALDVVRHSVRDQEQLNARAAAAFCNGMQCGECDAGAGSESPAATLGHPDMQQQGAGCSAASVGDAGAAAHALQSQVVQSQPAPVVGWQSCPLAMPEAWDERADVAGEQWERRSAEALRFISRRRAEPEHAEVLAHRPLPTPHVPPDMPVVEPQFQPNWPAGAPARPVRVHQLYYEGIYDEILEMVGEIAGDVAEAELEVRCGVQPAPMRKRETRVWRAAECQPEWARACPWDCTDPADCVPLRPFSASEPVTHTLSKSFFVQWGERLHWPDKDMLHQIAVTGAEGRSACERDTVIMGHHKGLRSNYLPARKEVAAGLKRGWIREGRLHLVTVPARLVPKNVVPRQQWKMVMGELRSVHKWRVTTDDSIESIAGDIRSRNKAMPREDWADMSLPSPQTLAEAVAQIRSVAAKMGIVAQAAALERIALWALDLSDAYREIEVNRSEWWQQGFVWYDGVRLDTRCVFGSAHMPGFFQRVSSFVLAVASFRVKQYDRQHPYSEARQAWSSYRSENVEGDNGDCDFASIYLDDGSGLAVLGAGEPLTGAPDVRKRPVASSVTVDPGGRVRLSLFGDKSRGQVHLQIFQDTFVEAGWRMSIEKIQYGLSLDLLGLGITTHGEGALFVPEAKRQGMIMDIQAAIEPVAKDGSVDREDFDRLVGRAGNLGQVAAEAKVYLQPLYRMLNAKSKYVDRRAQQTVSFKPKRIVLRGRGPTQIRCREALQWYKAALESGMSVPLAPRRQFPAVGDPGCAFCFTDAAREARTGHGGFTVVQRSKAQHAEFLYLEQRWSADVLTALQGNELSMVGGEAYGAVVLADAVLTELGDATHMVVFTDSAATEVAINTGNSPSPQLNLLVRWLVERWPGVQFLGVWQQGTRNDVADRVSREGLAAVLAEAEGAGLRARQLHACSSADDLLQAAWAEPQTASN